MRFTIHKLIYAGALTVIVTLVVVPAVQSLTLPVPEVAQEQTEWCWAGVAQATLAYFESDLEQCDIADFARVEAEWGEDDCCVNPDGAICNQPNAFYGAAGSLEDILGNWGVGTAAHDSAITGDQIKDIIDAGTPFLIRWGWVGGGAHMVVGRGYTGNNNHIMDPTPGQGYLTVDHDYLVSNENFEWTHTLGDICLPCGNGDASDDGSLDTTDLSHLWNYLYRGGSITPAGLQNANADCCCSVDIGDYIVLMDYIFFGGPLPPAGSDCNGGSGGDVVELRLISPPVSGDASAVVQVDLYASNYFTLPGTSIGFEWSSPNLQMDSVRVDPVVTSAFNIVSSTYYVDDIDSTNHYRRFLLAGAGVGLNSSYGMELWASYYFTASDWTDVSVLRIGLSEFSQGSQVKFVGVDSMGNKYNYTPDFAGDLVYSYEGIIRPEPGALVQQGSEYPIEWTEQDGVLNYAIDLSRNDGGSWANITTAATDNIFGWTVTGDTSSTCLIRVYDADNPSAPDTMFSGLFLIVEGVFVSLDDPGGGLRAESKIGTGGGVDSDLKGPGEVTDLMVLYENGQVDFFSGHGDGTFDATGTIVIDIASLSTDMELADINEDGHLDAAISNAALSLVSFHFGDGLAGFTSHLDDFVQTDGQPLSLEMVDLDRDGDLDLAVITQDPSQLLIYTGLGSGSFLTPPVTLALTDEADAIATGHLNDDAYVDIAVVQSSSGVVSVFMGSGDGSFTLGDEKTIGAGASELVIADFDGSGSGDIGVIYESGSMLFMTLMNDGAGIFDTTSYPVLLDGHSAVFAGDFSGDGITDVAITSRTRDSLAILPGLVGGGFGYPVLHGVGDEPIDITCDDFNQDGSADLVVFNYGSQDISVLAGVMPTSLNTDITVVSPAGGEDWETSTDQTIIWSKGTGVASVDVEITRDDGSTWQTIGLNVSDTTMLWRVCGPGTTTASVRVFDRTVPGRNGSSGLFTITALCACGDIDCNGVGPDIADLVYLVLYMFQDGPDPVSFEATDMDGNGVGPDIADLVHMVVYMFQDGPDLQCP